MVRYKRSIKTGVVRIPKEIKDAFGDDIEILPNKRSLVMYPASEDKRKIIRSLQVIISDLEQDIEDEGLGVEWIPLEKKERDTSCDEK